MVATLKIIQQDWRERHRPVGSSRPERALIRRLQGQIARQRRQLEEQELQLTALRQAIPPRDEEALRKERAEQEAALLWDSEFHRFAFGSLSDSKGCSFFF